MKNSPNKILISPDTIDDICERHLKDDFVDKIFWALLGINIPSVLTIIVSIDNGWDYFDTIYATVIGILMIFNLCLLIYKILNRNHLKINEKIFEQTDKETEYSALFIISRVTTDLNGVTRKSILVQRKDSWNCDFLPYVEIDKKTTLDAQTDTLKKQLASKININDSLIKINHIEDGGCYSIKLSVPDQTEKIFRYEFYNVFLESFIQPSIFKSEKWIEIEDFYSDAHIMRINGDVIDNLNRLKSEICDSFYKPIENKNTIKIVWNITNQCPFNCDICATCSNTVAELTSSEKHQALLSILTIRDSIRELNFAGGDPLAKEIDRKIIRTAMSVFEKNRISTSTTGKSIHNLSDTDKLELLTNCVVTIDLSKPERNDIRKTTDYNQTNIRYINQNRKHISYLRINVPILNTDVSDKDVDKVVQKINQLKPNDVSLIKLMPVGKQLNNEYPANYDAMKIVEKIREKIDNVNIHLHCALRCEEHSNQEQCNMLTNKLGIDCQGNVYACCWAGYLGCTKDKNPFYIGNLLEKDLKDIIHDSAALNILENTNRDECNIFKYTNDNKI